MQFSLQTLMLAFVVVAAAVGLFGLAGLLISAVVLACAAYIRLSRDSEKAFYNVVVTFIFLFPFLCCLIIPLLVRINEVLGNYFQLESTYNRYHCSEPPEFPYSILMGPTLKILLMLTIFIGATMLIIRRPLPATEEMRKEEEEEIRLEDTSEPEEKVEEKDGIIKEDSYAPQPSPPAPLPKGEGRE